MLSNLPRHHYVHVYLDEVRPYQFNVDNVELNDEPIVKESLVEPIVEENFVEPKTNDNVDEEHSVEVYISEPSVEENFVEPEIDDNVDEEHSVEVNIGEPSDDGNVVDSNSDSEDIDYEVSKSTSYESGFTDTENESDFEGVGDNVTREESHKHNWKGSDEIMVDSDPESGHSDSFHSLDEAGSDGPHKKPLYPKFNTTTDISNPIFKASPVHFKEPYGTWQIKSFTGEHRCLREYKNSNVTASFMAKQYLDKLFTDPNYSSKSLKQDIFRDYSIFVHLSKCTRAKNLALEILHGNIKEQYKKLYDYLSELRSSNPGTTTILKLDEGIFERLYICMQALKDGFKAGCRPIICLDGCHLKGHYGGHLLAVVGMDADGCLYPIAFAIMEAETESSWCWFMEILKTELNNSHHITFMNDKQKMLACEGWWSNYQVSCGPQDQHSVNIQTSACSCRRWQLTGIPCIYAISVILYLEDRLVNYVDPCYSVSTQKAIYSHFIKPMRGENQWSLQQTHLQVLPPVLRRPSGRPHKKHRRREPDEAPQGVKVSRKGLNMYCTKCGGSGHNTRTCKGLVRANTRPNKRPSTAATSRSKRPSISCYIIHKHFVFVYRLEKDLEQMSTRILLQHQTNIVGNIKAIDQGKANPNPNHHLNPNYHPNLHHQAKLLDGCSPPPLRTTLLLNLVGNIKATVQGQANLHQQFILLD
ncbi:hypothetical protein V6N13_040009 [Hibiscus sabdariffa]